MKQTIARLRRKCELLELAVRALAAFIILLFVIIVIMCSNYNEIISIMEERNDSLNEMLELYSNQASAENKEDRVEPVMSLVYSRGTAPLYDLALDSELQQFTYDICMYYEIEDHYETVLAIMWKESNFVADAISESDDYGLMQINKCNHEYLQETLGIVDILDEKSNIAAGVYIFSDLIKKYEDLDKALMAYNMGERGAAELWSMGNYTSSYAMDVQSKLNILQK